MLASRQFALDHDAGTPPGPVFFAFTAISAAILLSLVAVTVTPAFEGRVPNRNAVYVREAAPAALVSGDPQKAASTIIYLVTDEAEVTRLQKAFEDWDQAIRDSGLEVDRLTRIVIAQKPDQVLQLFDFGYIRRDVRVVDLRH